MTGMDDDILRWNVGSWIRSRRDGVLVIGVVQYVHRSPLNSWRRYRCGVFSPAPRPVGAADAAG